MTRADGIETVYYYIARCHLTAAEHMLARLEQKLGADNPDVFEARQELHNAWIERGHGKVV